MLQPYLPPPTHPTHMLRYDKVVCIILQLNPSRHFNVCFKHCQKETVDLPMKTKLYRSYFVELLAKSSVCV